MKILGNVDYIAILNIIGQNGSIVAQYLNVPNNIQIYLRLCYIFASPTQRETPPLASYRTSFWLLKIVGKQIKEGEGSLDLSERTVTH